MTNRFLFALIVLSSFVEATFPAGAIPVPFAILAICFDFLAGSAGRATPQGSYFSLGSGILSSAAFDRRAIR